MDPLGLRAEAAEIPESRLDRFQRGNTAYMKDNERNDRRFAGTLEIQAGRGDDSLISGHAWIAFTSDSTAERHTYGTWNRPELGLVGVETDTELNWTGDVSRTARITLEQEWTLQQYIGERQGLGEKAWGYLCNCSEFSQEAWNRTTGEALQNRNAAGIPNPNSLADSILEANRGQPHATVGAAVNRDQ